MMDGLVSQMASPFHPAPLGAKLLLGLVSTALCLLAVEGAFRLLEFDFEASRREAHTAYPIFYRLPRKPLGDFYFQRPGPATWTGRVLATGLHQDRGLDEAYANETAVTITYDPDGFRNPDTLADWDVVVVGDSFVELGHLPHDTLFTTQLGRMLGVRVKNLGTSHSGPLTYLAYLKRFGVAPSARHAVMVFFEGNDLIDLQRELRWRELFATTGTRVYRDFEPQPSFLKAVYRLTKRLLREGWPRARYYRNAFFDGHDGAQAVTVDYTPPSSDGVAPVEREALAQVLKTWSQTAYELGMQPWVVYMPCKRRVLDGRLRFTDDASDALLTWKPTDLPTLIQELTVQQGAGFIDMTPALRRETRQGRLTYNPVWDTHLNRLGASIVAQVLAVTLREQRK